MRDKRIDPNKTPIAIAIAMAHLYLPELLLRPVSEVSEMRNTEGFQYAT